MPITNYNVYSYLLFNNLINLYYLIICSLVKILFFNYNNIGINTIIIINII